MTEKEAALKQELASSISAANEKHVQRLQTMHAEIEKLSNGLANSSQREAALKKDIVDLKQSLEDAQGKVLEGVRQKEKEMDALRAENDKKFQTAIQEYKTGGEMMLKDLSTIQATANQALSEKNKMQAELVAARENIKALESNAQNAQNSEKLLKDLSTVQAEAKKALSDKANVESDLSAVQAELEAARGKIKALEMAFHGSKDTDVDLAQVREELIAARGNIKVLEENVESVQKNFVQVNSAKSSAVNELNAALKKQAEFEARLKASTEKNADVIKKYEAEKQASIEKQASVEKERAELNARLTSTEQQLGVAMNQAFTNDKERTELNARLAETEKQLGVAKNQHDALQKLLKDFEAKNDQSLRTAKTKQTEWAAKEVDLKKNIQLLQANLDKAEQIRQQTLADQESTKNMNDAHVKEVCNPHL